MEFVNIYCFDLDDEEGRNLRYHISLQSENGSLKWKTTDKIMNIRNTVDEAMFRVPEGYTITEYDKTQKKYVETDKLTPKDNYPNE